MRGVIKAMIRYNPGLSSRVLKFRVVNTQIRVTTSCKIIEVKTIFISHNPDGSFISGTCILSSFSVPWNVF